MKQEICPRSSLMSHDMDTYHFHLIFAEILDLDCFDGNLGEITQGLLQNGDVAVDGGGESGMVSAAAVTAVVDP
ncbi:hypothetical protein QYF36_016753 [Acer negundo]|nr:hypothetical protein QYF36_016753 [Acer negundo]